MSIKYHPEDFPILPNYIGLLYNYIIFLVLRFYDNEDDFIFKLNSLNNKIQVYKTKEKLILTKLILYNPSNNIRVELSKLDNKFTTAVKLLHLLLGDDFIQQKIAINTLVTLTEEDFELTPNYIPEKML